MPVKPIPEGYHSVTPYLIIKGASAAIDFYKKAFGATELFRMPDPSGKGVAHAEIKIGDSPIMLADEQPQMRSEEHTSELQSQSNLVCRLLLENNILPHT